MVPTDRNKSPTTSRSRVIGQVLAGIVVLGASVGSAWWMEHFGWDDPQTGRHVCGKAPGAVAAWARNGRSPAASDLADLQRWLAGHPEAVNERYTSSCATPLHIAARFGREDLSAVLLDQGASVDSVNAEGDEPLHVAAQYGHAQVVELLLRRSARAGARGAGGRTPLHDAVLGLGTMSDLAGATGVVNALVAARADVNARDSGSRFTPLRYAVLTPSSDRARFVQLLLDNGADPSLADRQGDPPVIAAASSGDVDTVRLLLDYGASASAAGHDLTALAAAAGWGHADVAALLLDRGADVNGRVDGSRLEWQGLALAMALVIPSAQDPEPDMVRRRGEAARVLLEHGADVDAQNADRQTVLHRAAFEGNTAAVELLLSHGASSRARDAVGWTPLHYAVQQGHVDVARRLLDRDEDIAISDAGTLLDLATADPDMEALIRRHERQ